MAPDRAQAPARQADPPRQDGLAGGEPLQVLRQRRRVGVAVLRILGQGLEADRLDVAVEGIDDRARRGRIGLDRNMGKRSRPLETPVRTSPTSP